MCIDYVNNYNGLGSGRRGHTRVSSALSVMIVRDKTYCFADGEHYWLFLKIRTRELNSLLVVFEQSFFGAGETRSKGCDIENAVLSRTQCDGGFN